jgi:hypothetical protein
MDSRRNSLSSAAPLVHETVDQAFPSFPEKGRSGSFSGLGTISPAHAGSLPRKGFNDEQELPVHPARSAGPSTLPKKHQRNNREPVEPQEKASCRPRAAIAPRQGTGRWISPKRSPPLRPWPLQQMAVPDYAEFPKKHGMAWRPAGRISSQRTTAPTPEGASVIAHRDALPLPSVHCPPSEEGRSGQKEAGSALDRRLRFYPSPRKKASPGTAIGGR